MIDLQSAELDEMIQAEKKQVALEYHNEAWADGMSDGIEAEILAETAITTALTELVLSGMPLSRLPLQANAKKN